MEGFYKTYHSIRYADGLTVLRLNHEISDKTLALINKEFKDILTSGEIRRLAPTNKRFKEKNFLICRGLAMDFNLRDYAGSAN